MKILYAVQATGNGHISRAREIIPHFEKYGSVDVLASGTQAEVQLHQKIKYQFKGYGFTFGTKGGIDFRKSFQEADFPQLIHDIRNLPVQDYGLIINDFEPVSAWACKLKSKKCIAMSHQSSFLSKKTPVIDGFHWGSLVLKNYAPASEKIGFHFQKYDDFIHTPVIRSEIRNLKKQNLGHYTVYLPAYSDEFIIGQLSKFNSIKFHVFSKHSKNAYSKENVDILPVDNEKFNLSLATSDGLLTGGGFEGPAEALFLEKKLLCVPMNHQYEQQCNAFAAEKMGVTVIWNEAEFHHKLSHWLHEAEIVPVHFPDETSEIVENLMRRFS